MKKFILPLAALIFGTSALHADNFAVYQRTVSGVQTTAFSALIQRIPAEYSNKKVTQTFWVIRNLNTSKDCYIQALVIGSKKSYYIEQPSTEKPYDSTVFKAALRDEKLDARSGVTTDKIQYIINAKSTATVPEFIADSTRDYAQRDKIRQLQISSGNPAVTGSAGVVSLVINDNFTLSGPIVTANLGTGLEAVSLAPVLSGGGASWQIHSLADGVAHSYDYESKEIFTLDFTEKWTLNQAVTKVVNVDNQKGITLDRESINPHTSAWAAYHVVKILKSMGYSQVF